MKLFVAILLFVGSASAFEVFDFDVHGFDEKGEKVRCESLREQESCSVTKSDFTEKCLAQGDRLLYCSDCTILCSQPVQD